MFPATRSTRAKRTRQVLPGAGRAWRVVPVALRRRNRYRGTPSETRGAGLGSPAAPRRGVGLYGKGSIANRALPFLFSLVLALQIPQQRPRENHGQDETHENAKDDITRDHKRVTKTPPSPNKRTTPPIIPATIPTFLWSNSSLWSKSSAITTPTQSNSVSTLSTHEIPPKSRTPLPDLSGFRHDNP